MRHVVVAGGLLIALAVPLINSVDRFYNATPRIMGTNGADMLIGALQARPNATSILAGQIANPSLCIVFAAYGLDQARIVHFHGGPLTPLCPSDQPMEPVAGASVQVLIVDVDLIDIAPCESLFKPVLFGPGRRQAIYGMQLPLPAGDRTTFLARVASSAAHACPLLPGLAQ
jgi:hypothetical protein